MRDLLFKNLISDDRRKRIIASSEIVERQGVRSIIRRHFICLIKEVADAGGMKKPLPHMYIVKEHNTREQKEKFFCKIKGSLCAMNKGKLFLIIFMHSLKINLASIPQQVG
ncbi:MAG: hypothetical protein WC478_04290 [Candidatus Omnitrophota bacterium]